MARCFLVAGIIELTSINENKFQFETLSKSPKIRRWRTFHAGLSAAFKARTRITKLVKVVQNRIEPHLPLRLRQHLFIIHEYAPRSVMLVLNFLLCAMKK